MPVLPEDPVDHRLATWTDLGAPMIDRLGDPPPFTDCDGKQHRFWLHDHDRAMRAIERIKEMGGTEFWTSPDFCHMLVRPHDGERCHARGFSLHCDENLPFNSIVRYEMQEIGDVIEATLNFPGIKPTRMHGKLYIARPPQEGGEP